MSDQTPTPVLVTDNSDKSLAQIAYETFLQELAKTEHGGEVNDAPAWANVPADVRDVLAKAVGEAVRSFAPALISDVAAEDMSFAQVGYQAYVARTGGLNYQGLPCPVFDTLPHTIKAAWAAASTAIRSEHEHRFAGDYDLVCSKEELAELVAGLDALQRADIHQAEVTFPLRSRLRAMLFPPAEEADEAPQVTVEEPKSSPSDDNQDGDDSNSPGAATESTNGERSEPETNPDPSPVALASELPVVSAAPPGPGLPGLEPVVSAPAAISTDISAPAEAPAEPVADEAHLNAGESPSDMVPEPKPES